MSGTDGAEEWVVAALGPSLIVYDTAAVIRRDGRLVYIYRNDARCCTLSIYFFFNNRLNINR